MGPGNMKLWKCCGINVGRYSELKNYHKNYPSDPNKRLYFIADITFVKEPKRIINK